MTDAPKDRYTALIYGVVAAVLLLVVAFGAPISAEQRTAILGVIAPTVALVQAVLTRLKTTDNGVVVAKAAAGKQAVAADASVYPNGTELHTVPSNVSEQSQKLLLNGTIKPHEV